MGIVVYSDCSHIQLTAPYISGFLAFREVSFLVDCIEKLKHEKPEYMPQVMFVDGNGMLHPRGFGVACHLGVITDMVTIGVAKKLLHVDGIEKDASHAEKIKQLTKGGESFPLSGSSGKILGKVLRVCDESSNPVYVSVGHKISLETAVDLVHRCSKHRIPEPIRQADIRSREFLREKYEPKLRKQPRVKLKKTKDTSDTPSLDGRNCIDDDELDCVISLFE
ncbi:endonuclease V-like isoform X2 [Antedon mediterranea]|uniref:endonuclease V-like isoform X2 n=1 Tax=Antedon mediterranea TaxID=105859 RepID=UPI003AF47595